MQPTRPKSGAVYWHQQRDGGVHPPSGLDTGPRRVVSSDVPVGARRDERLHDDHAAQPYQLGVLGGRREFPYVCI